jgi:glycerophosphoryl diester phosphodiesterase
MKPKICAHRGASHKFPENSLQAFIEAVEQKADSIEVDVRQTRDGHLVACHDFNLSRLTGCHKRLSEVTFDEFRQLKINGQESTASLDEIMSEAGKHVDIILDVKENGLENKILKMISRLALEDKVIVSSFDPRIIANIKRINPEITTAFIAGPFSILPLATNICFYLRRVSEYIRSDYMHLCYMKILHPGFKTLSGWGYKISYWTVDNPKDIRNILNLSPESIITNRPGLARRVVSRAKK